MAKLILGMAGEMGSGKGAAGEYVKEKFKADEYNFSQILRRVLDSLYLEQSRENLKNLSYSLRETFGEDVLARAMHKMVEQDKSEVVFIGGVRRIEDIQHLRQLPHFKLIYVDAEMETRYKRITKRNENANEAQKTFEEFKASHQYETEVTIPPLRNYADYVVDNNGGVEELYKQIDQIIEQNI